MTPLTTYVLGPLLNLAPPLNLTFCSGPTQLFWSEMFRFPLKLEGLLPWFARFKGQFIDRNDKLWPEQAILKSYLLEYNKHLQTLRLSHDEISNKIKSNYGWTFHKLCIVNIISALCKENKLQLRCKNSKFFRLIPRKKDSQYQVPVLNLSTENINTAPLW